MFYKETVDAGPEKFKTSLKIRFFFTFQGLQVKVDTGYRVTSEIYDSLQSYTQIRLLPQLPADANLTHRMFLIESRFS